MQKAGMTQESLLESAEKCVQYREIECLTYGSDEFLPDKFVPVTQPMDHFRIKPKNGLWGSPVDSEHGWEAWCRGEDFRLQSLDKSFRWTFKGRIFVVDSIGDMLSLPWKKQDRLMGEIDWPALVSIADGFYLTAEGEARTRFADPVSLYGYDCETVLAFSLDSIYPEQDDKLGQRSVQCPQKMSVS